jgi:rieske iron-sulfur protein
MSDPQSSAHSVDADAALTSRRAVIQAVMGVSFGLAGLSVLSIVAGLKPELEQTPDREPVKTGDVLVFAQGPKAGQPITPDDIPLESGAVLAFPMDADTKVVKGAEVKNTLVLARNAAGVVAFSAVCTHLGCTVSVWRNDALYCPCHNTLFDPFDQARVTAGPAPRPLAALPVKLEGNQIVVSGEFQGKVGV